MTTEELNAVWILKQRISEETQRLTILRICVENMTVESADGVKESQKRNIDSAISDTEQIIKDLRGQKDNAVVQLTQRINDVGSDMTERLLLAYRYVACKPFREIARLMGYSIQHIFKKHRLLLKALKKDS